MDEMSQLGVSVGDMTLNDESFQDDKTNAIKFVSPRSEISAYPGQHEAVIQ